MVDRRFDELREALLRTGVAPRHIRRALSEMKDHFQQLVAAGIERGQSDEDARAEAHRRLGANPELIQRYANQPELQAWSRRRPAVYFALLPAASYLLIAAASVGLFCVTGHYLAPHIHHISIAPEVTRRIDMVARWVFGWLLPCVVAAAFAILAYRRRALLAWPCTGVVAVSVWASLLNVDIILTGGADAGRVGAGIGVSMQALPHQMTHAATIAMLALTPLWLASRAQRQRF